MEQNPRGEFVVWLPFIGDNTLANYYDYLQWFKDRGISPNESSFKAAFSTPTGKVLVPLTFFFDRGDDAIAFRLKFGI